METGYRMKTTSRRDYLQKIYHGYRRAGKAEKLVPTARASSQHFSS